MICKWWLSMMMKPNRLKPIFYTFFSIVAMITLIRLGFWQLDRLEWRRNFNNHYLKQIALPELIINNDPDSDFLLSSEYRSASVSGRFDFSQQVFLQNHVYQNIPGYHVLTPFLIENLDKAILVDRGWISLDDINQIGEIDQLSSSIHEIHGVLRMGEEVNSFGSNFEIKDNNPDFFLLVNFEQLNKRISYDLLPVYVQLEKKIIDGLPYPQEVEVEITEGPHLGYAIQWFFFASVVGVGYPFFIKKLIRENNNS